MCLFDSGVINNVNDVLLISQTRYVRQTGIGQVVRHTVCCSVVVSV